MRGLEPGSLVARESQGAASIRSAVVAASPSASEDTAAAVSHSLACADRRRASHAPTAAAAEGGAVGRELLWAQFAFRLDLTKTELPRGAGVMGNTRKPFFVFCFFYILWVPPHNPNPLQKKPNVGNE